MSFDKKRVAAVSAIAAGVAVAAGGYCVSLANYSSTLEKARIGIEQYITKSANLEPGKVSVAFFEPDSALFSHKVTLVVTDGEDSFKLPMSITSGYASYSFDLDVVNATVNRENALAHFDLTELTKLEAYGKLNLISGQLSFTSNASFLNDAKFLRDHAFATAFDKFQKQKSQEVQAQAQAQREAAAAVAQETKEAASDAQEIASVDTVKDTPVTADLDTAGAAAEAQANASEQVAVAEVPETEAVAAQETNESEQAASDAQEIASVETVKDTPVTADLDTAGAAAEAQANESEQVAVAEVPETEVAAAQETNESEQAASDAQEIASVDTVKDTPVTADLDTAGAAAEAQANASEQVAVAEVPETEAAVAQETNESEQVASDAQEIASVDTVKDTPVTADLDTAGAAAEAQANASEQVAVAEVPETEAAVAPETNASEQAASDAQEIASVETVKDTPVTADLDTAGAAAEAQANASEQVAVAEVPETEAAVAPETKEAASDAQEIASVDTVKDTPVTADLDTAGAAAEAQANASEQVAVAEVPETEAAAAQEGEGLTNLKEMVVKAEADKNEAKLSQMAKEEFQELVKKVGFKEVGNLSISVSIDSDENVKSSVSIDSFHRNGMGLTNLSVYGENKGLLAIKSVGRSEVALANVYEISYNGLSNFKDIVMKLNSPYTSKNGNFNLDYLFKLGDYNGYKNIEATGSLNGLNIGIFNSDDSIGALAKSIENNGLELSFNKGSKFSVDSKVRANQDSDVQEREVTVDFAGKLALPKGEPFNLFFSIPQGEVDFNLDLDARNLADPEFIYDEDIIKGFEVKNGKSYGKLVVTKEQGMPSVLVNGQEIFLK